jgi:hypothetical protein
MIVDESSVTGPSQTGHSEPTADLTASTADATADPPADTADATRVIAALATSPRLLVFSAVVLGARRPSEIAERTGLDDARVVAALARLQTAGLVIASPDGFAAVPAVFADIARRQAQRQARERPVVDYGTDDPGVIAVLNAFMSDGRITSMPAQRSKRRILLEHIVVVFEPGRRDTEPEVNAILASFHRDTATVRRYLVDEQLLDRADGLYWRIGGWVDVLD